MHLGLRLSAVDNVLWVAMIGFMKRLRLHCFGEGDLLISAVTINVRGASKPRVANS